MKKSTAESSSDFVTESYAITNFSTKSTPEVNITILISTILASGGGSGGGSKGPECFYWDLFVKITLNSMLAVLGFIGNR